MSITFHNKPCENCYRIFEQVEGYCMDCDFEEDDEALDREEWEQEEEKREEEDNLNG